MWLASLAPPRSPAARGPRPGGAPAGRPPLGRARQRQQRAQALLGRRARVGGAPPRLDPQSGRRLALDDHGLVAVLGQLTGLEAEAAVEGGEALGVAEPARAPLLVGHQQNADLRVELWPSG